MSDLARDVGIKPQTARDWLSVLEATNQVSLLEPYFENIGKRIVKSPKLYLNDPGMLCFLLGLDATTLLTTPLIGNIWETFVYAEFRKRLNATPSAGTLWFYRDAQGREVDLIEMTGGRLNLFEIKWTDDAASRWISNLEEVAAALSKSKTQSIGERVLISRSPQPQRQGPVQITNPVDYLYGQPNRERNS
jgi:predicted AAA+ superfamily ATPase